MTEGAGRLFYNLRPKGATITLGPKGRRPLSEANTTLLHNPRQSRAPFEPFEPFEPSEPF